MIILAETNPTDLLKDPGFAQWVVYAIGAFMLWERVQKYLDRKKATDVNVIDGEMKVSEKKRFADKTETEKALSRISDRLTSLEAKVSVEYQGLLIAGSNREASIKDAIHTMKDHIGDKLNDALKDAYHRINEHGERISAAEARLGMAPRPQD